MKIFQIVNGITYDDVTALYPNAEYTKNIYSPETLFVDTPDYVFLGWGYDETKEGDERFIKPTPPEGWLYDDETGTFYPAEEIPPSQRPTLEQRVTTLEENGDIWDELAAAYREGVDSI